MGAAPAGLAYHAQPARDESLAAHAAAITGDLTTERGADLQIDIRAMPQITDAAHEIRALDAIDLSVPNVPASYWFEARKK